MARTTGQADNERLTKEANIRMQIAQDQGAAAFYRQSAESALTGGTLGMIGTGLCGLSGAFSSWKSTAAGPGDPFHFLNGGMP